MEPKMKKTEELLEILRKELKDGRYPPGGKFPSEQKLMTRFKAARPTINKITEQLVSEGFIERGVQGSGTRVRDIAPFPGGELAYLGSIGSPYYARILHGIQLAAFQNNYAVSFFSPPRLLINFCLDKIARSKYQGLLVANIGLIPESFPIPVVYVDNGFENHPPNHASVTCTNYKGAADMAEAVLAHGHREILICSNHASTEEGRGCRVRGFLDTLQRHGLRDAELRVFHELLIDTSSAKFLLRKMLKQFPETTVILSDSDGVASYLFQAMQGMDLPRRITVTGFGNLSQGGGLLKFPGVEQHPDEIGIQSVNELFRLIAEPGSVSPGMIEIETELVNLDRLPYLSPVSA